MYSRISSSHNGAAAIAYASARIRGHNGHKHRNLLVSTVNMIPNGKYVEQMNKYWKRARKNHSVQVRRIIFSFSEKEADPENAADVEKCDQLVREFIKNYYPDRQCAIFWQADGKGRSGKQILHCHAIVNDCAISPPFKGCSKQQQNFHYVRNIDKIAAKYLKLDAGEEAKSKQNQTERSKRDKAEQITKNTLGLKGAELQKKLIQEKAYSSREDLKNRIHEAMINTDSEQSFVKNLSENGVTVEKRYSKKYGYYYLYNFTGCPIKQKNSRYRSYRLGFSFSPAAMKSYWNERDRLNDSPAAAKSTSDDFVLWMQRNNKSYFTFDKTGKITADFELMEQLRAEYESEKNNPVSADKAETAEEFEEVTLSDPSRSDRQSTTSVKSHKEAVKQDLAALGKLASIAAQVADQLKAEQEEKNLTQKRTQNAIEQLNINNISMQKQTEKSL